MASKKELALNAARWMQAAKRERISQDGIGAIFMFFNLDDPEGSAVCVGSVDRERVAQACKDILRKINKGNLIVNPFEN